MVLNCFIFWEYVLLFLKNIVLWLKIKCGFDGFRSYIVFFFNCMYCLFKFRKVRMYIWIDFNE